MQVTKRKEKAYNRISSERSTVHSNIYEPDYVVVVDETLLSAVDVTAGLKKGGTIVINSGKAPEELCKNFPNTPMLAAIVKVSGVVEADQFISDMEASFKHKFATKSQVIEGRYLLSYKPKEKKPVVEYLKAQDRFAHMFKPGNEWMIEEVQKEVDKNWEDLLKLCER